MIRPAQSGDAALLAAIHARCFEDRWTEKDFAALLASPGVFALILEGAGLIVARCAADEAEVLTLCTVPELRRAGTAARLLDSAIAQARCNGSIQLFLEVAADNIAAQSLYAKAGFAPVGARRGYYGRVGRPPADALTLSLKLQPPQ